MCTAQGSDEFAQMRRINRAFASRLCDKYENLMCWPIFIIVSVLHYRKSGTYSFGLICVCVCTRINVRKIIVPRSQKKNKQIKTRKQLILSDMQPKARQDPISGHYRSASKTPLGWRLAWGPIVTRYYVLTGEMGLNP